MSTLLMVLSVFAFSVNSITIRTFQLKHSKNEHDTDLFQSSFCIVASIAYFIGAKFTFNLNFAQTMSAALFGVFFALAVLLSALCYTCGPMSITSVIVNSSVVIPILYSTVTLGEKITTFQAIGFVLLMLTFILSALQADKTKKEKVNTKWLIFVFVALSSNGTTAVIQKIYKLSAPMSNGNAFMSVAYFTAAIVLFVYFLIGKNKKTNEKYTKIKITPGSAILVLLAGLGSFAGNGILMKLITDVPAAILFPFLNGGICITVSIFSILIFKEKLTLKKALTILTGLSAVVVLNL